MIQATSIRYELVVDQIKKNPKFEKNALLWEGLVYLDRQSFRALRAGTNRLIPNHFRRPDPTTARPKRFARKTTPDPQP